MIEIKLSDYENLKKKCNVNNIVYKDNILLYAAKDMNIDDTVQNELGYCMFEIKGDTALILELNINSQENIFIADGILRTTLNYLLDHEIKIAAYSGVEYIKYFVKLGFTEQSGLYTIDINEDIFKSCGN